MLTLLLLPFDLALSVCDLISRCTFWVGHSIERLRYESGPLHWHGLEGHSE